MAALALVLDPVAAVRAVAHKAVCITYRVYIFFSVIVIYYIYIYIYIYDTLLIHTNFNLLLFSDVTSLSGVTFLSDVTFSSLTFSDVTYRAR